MRYLAQMIGGCYAEIDVEAETPLGLACALVDLMAEYHGWIPSVGGMLVNPDHIEVIAPSPVAEQAPALAGVHDDGETIARFVDNLTQELGEFSVRQNAGRFWPRNGRVIPVQRPPSDSAPDPGDPGTLE